MPADNTLKFKQNETEYVPLATVSTYCQPVIPVSPDVHFSAGHVLPKEITSSAGSCSASTPVPSQAESPPSWDLPTMTGMSPALGLTRFWSTLDSTIAGNGPRPGGWRQPEVHRTHPEVVDQAAGGKKRKASRKTKRRPSKKVKSKRGGKVVSRKTRRGSRKGSRKN